MDRLEFCRNLAARAGRLAPCSEETTVKKLTPWLSILAPRAAGVSLPVHAPGIAAGPATLALRPHRLRLVAAHGAPIGLAFDPKDVIVLAR